jgi:hypothetical protein
MILYILSEKELITIDESLDIATIKVIENPQKADLTTASAYDYLSR